MRSGADFLSRLGHLPQPVLAFFAYPPTVLIAPGVAATLLVAIGIYGMIFVLWHGRVPLSRPAGAFLFAALAWLLAKSVGMGSAGMAAWARLLLLSLAGAGTVAMMADLPPAARRQAGRALISGCLVALPLAWLGGPDLLNWAPPWRGDRITGYTGLAVLCFPAFFALLRERGIGWSVAFALMAVVPLAVAALRTEPRPEYTGAAAAAIFGLAGLALGYGMRRLGLIAIAALSAAMIVAAPFVHIPVVSSAPSLAGWWGQGLGSATDTAINFALGPPPVTVVDQVWFELGLPGALLLAAAAAISLIAASGPHTGPTACATRAAIYLACAAPMFLALSLFSDGWYATLWMVAAAGIATDTS